MQSRGIHPYHLMVHTYIHACLQISISNNKEKTFFTNILYISTKPYDVTNRKNRLKETILTNGHIIGYIFIFIFHF